MGIIDCEENVLSNQIIHAAIEVHNVLGGPGLLESVYEDALFYELTIRGIPVRRQVRIPINYKGKVSSDFLQLDLIVNDRVIIEIKATEKHNPIFTTQLLTYLRLSNLKLGLLINFGEIKIYRGVRRVVNGL
jgi:GxxExxY protein